MIGARGEPTSSSVTVSGAGRSCRMGADAPATRLMSTTFSRTTTTRTRIFKPSVEGITTRKPAATAARVAGSPAPQEEPAQAGEALDAPGGRRRLTQEGSQTSDQITQEVFEIPTPKKRSEERLGHRTKAELEVVSKGEMQPVRWPRVKKTWSQQTKDLYNSVKDSGTSYWYQQSDVARL